MPQQDKDKKKKFLVLFKTILFRDFHQNHLGAKCNNYPLTLSKGSYEDSEKLRVNYLIFLLPSCVTKIKTKNEKKKLDCTEIESTMLYAHCKINK